MIRINVFVVSAFLLAATHAIAQDDPCSKKYEQPDNSIIHRKADSAWLMCSEPEIRILAVAGHRVTRDLAWRRCSEGQTWKAVGNTCKGKASVFTYDQAVAHTETQNGWRLPSSDELSTLYPGGNKDTPAIDLAAFPATPGFIFWSSTTSQAGSNDHAWGYDFRDGGVIVNTLRSRKFHVRLVRNP